MYCDVPIIWPSLHFFLLSYGHFVLIFCWLSHWQRGDATILLLQMSIVIFPPRAISASTLLSLWRTSPSAVPQAALSPHLTRARAYTAPSNLHITRLHCQLNSTLTLPDSHYRLAFVTVVQFQTRGSVTGQPCRSVISTFIAILHL